MSQARQSWLHGAKLAHPDSHHWAILDQEEPPSAGQGNRKWGSSTPASLPTSVKPRQAKPMRFLLLTAFSGLFLASYYPASPFIHLLGYQYSWCVSNVSTVLLPGRPSKSVADSNLHQSAPAYPQCSVHPPYHLPRIISIDRFSSLPPAVLPLGPADWMLRASWHPVALTNRTGDHRTAATTTATATTTTTTTTKTATIPPIMTIATPDLNLPVHPAQQPTSHL
ncbi:hypothetical protein B0I35DRAFT_236611 [Stachybotrys elegans]|uniref:Uncharacterized protein n=1 Tax=Stachybotrys elegans TaxID=80388 RepID=A0A8K0WQB0_9HYPO|nr:hypothetical protein B0I35DRAFT_236611 [Stachybotrys elegans]